MRALYIVHLDLVAPAQALPGTSEGHAGIVVPDMPDVHLQLKITEGLVGAQEAIAIGVQHTAERLKDCAA